MRMRRLIMTMFCLLPMAALMYGCGSSSKTGGTLSSVATVSEATCLGCHASWTEELTGRSIVADHNASLHKTKMVGCQDCHGGGAQHNGVGPMPYTTPDHNQCASCHSEIVDAYVASNHGSDAFTIEAGANYIKCARCHTHQGAVISNATGFTGDKAVMDSLVGAPGVIEEADARRVQCVTCHTTHKADELRSVKTRDGGGNIVDWQPSTTVGVATPSTNQQFNLCTSCHTYTNPDGTLVASGTRGTAEFYHNTAWYRTIASTHYDNPATTTLIEGYVLRTNGANPCFDCHGHEAKAGSRYAGSDATRATIYTDWAQSGHGGGLLTAKYVAADALGNVRSTAVVEAVMDAGSDGAAYSWGHYPWQTAGRAACQKCHTATGAANYLSSPATYVAANNVFTHLTLDGSGNGQQELLYCWGCHSDAGKGTLRAPGAITTEYAYGGAAITLPNAGKSNVCIVCHAGRGNTQTAATSRFQAHHAPAAAVLFADKTHVGYEFTGRDYTKPAYFKHDTIGMTDGTGPCASCHMSGKNHKFAAVTKDNNGAITVINNESLCATCHTGNYALTPAILEEESEGYQEAGSLLVAYANNTLPNYINAAVTSASVGNNYGAFQNKMLHTEEKGGFAHNRIYVKRLIFDSIDWLVDGAFNGTITINAATHPKAAHWLNANGTTGVATRP